MKVFKVFYLILLQIHFEYFKFSHRCSLVCIVSTLPSSQYWQPVRIECWFLFVEIAYSWNFLSMQKSKLFYSYFCRYHLQALRHLAVLAAEPRLLVPVDVDNLKPCYALLEVTYKVNRGGGGLAIKNWKNKSTKMCIPKHKVTSVTCKYLTCTSHDPFCLKH